MKIRMLALFLLLCVVFCGCNANGTKNQTNEANTTAPVSNTVPTEESDTTPTEKPETPTIPDEYQDMDFPLDVFDPTQDVTEPQPATEPTETEPVTEPEPSETAPPATTPDSGIVLPEIPF